MGSGVGRGRRLTVTATTGAAAVVMAVAVAVTATDGAGVREGPGPRGRAPAPAPRAVADTPFAGAFLVEGIHGFTAAQVARMTNALDRPVVPVTIGELLVRTRPRGYGAAPVATMVVDPLGYAEALGDPSIAAALSRGAVVARTTAQLLGVTVGDVLRPTNSEALRVAAVVPDPVTSGYQAAVGPGLAALAGFRVRSRADYVIVRSAAGQVAREQSSVRAALPARRLRFVVPRRNAFFSPSSHVLSQGQVQQRFGMFAIRSTTTGFSVDPSWVAANITVRHVPLLGSVVCNRMVMPALVAAMTDLRRRGLGT